MLRRDSSEPPTFHRSHQDALHFAPGCNPLGDLLVDGFAVADVVHELRPIVTDLLGPGSSDALWGLQVLLEIPQMTKVNKDAAVIVYVNPLARRCAVREWHRYQRTALARWPRRESRALSSIAVDPLRRRILIRTASQKCRAGQPISKGTRLSVHSGWSTAAFAWLAL
jgi:hypothetical protein